MYLRKEYNNIIHLIPFFFYIKVYQFFIQFIIKLLFENKIFIDLDLLKINEKKYIKKMIFY